MPLPLLANSEDILNAKIARVFPGFWHCKVFTLIFFSLLFVIPFFLEQGLPGFSECFDLLPRDFRSSPRRRVLVFFGFSLLFTGTAVKQKRMKADNYVTASKSQAVAPIVVHFYIGSLSVNSPTCIV